METSTFPLLSRRPVDLETFLGGMETEPSSLLNNVPWDPLKPSLVEWKPEGIGAAAKRRCP